jgi:hypothetical protein
MALHELQRRATGAAEALTSLNDQLTPIKDRLKDAPNVPDATKKAVDDLDKQVVALRPKFGVGGAPGGGFGGMQQNVRGRIGQLKGAIMNSTSLPTAGQQRQTDEVKVDLSKAIDDLNKVLAAAPAVIKDLADNGIYPAVPGQVK